MRTKDFAFVGAKIVGIIVFIQGIRMLVSSIIMWNSSFQEGSQLFSSILIINSLLCAILLGIGVFLWGYTGKILRFLVPKDNNNHEDSVDQGKVELRDLQTAAFTVVGLVILSDAIIKIFYAAAEILASKSLYFPIFTDGRVNPFSIQLIIKSLGHLIYLSIGIYLVFGIKNFLYIVGKGFRKLRRDIDKGDENGENGGDTH